MVILFGTQKSSNGVHFLNSVKLNKCLGVIFVNYKIKKQQFLNMLEPNHNSLIQYIPRNMHTVTALLCFVVVIHWLIFPYPSGLLHWHCGNLTIAPVPAKQPWWIWINTSCEFIMNDCITTTKQSTRKPCAYFLGYTVYHCTAKEERICVIMAKLFLKRIKPKGGLWWPLLISIASVLDKSNVHRYQICCLVWCLRLILNFHKRMI